MLGAVAFAVAAGFPVSWLADANRPRTASVTAQMSRVRAAMPKSTSFKAL